MRVRCISIEGGGQQSPSTALKIWDFGPRCAEIRSETCLTADQPDYTGRSAQSLVFSRGCLGCSTWRGGTFDSEGMASKTCVISADAREHTC
jgi:hypothetical protein